MIYMCVRARVCTKVPVRSHDECKQRWVTHANHVGTRERSTHVLQGLKLSKSERAYDLSYGRRSQIRGMSDLHLEISRMKL